MVIGHYASMFFHRGRHTPSDPPIFPNSLSFPRNVVQGAEAFQWTQSSRTCGIRKLQPPPFVDPPLCYSCRDLNRYLALCGFSTRNLSRCLILILTSAVPSSTCPLRLHSNISSGAGPFLVTAANTTMGHLHIHRQPLRRPIGTRPYHLLLLFRSLAGLSGGPTRLKMLSAAQISPVSRSGGPDDRWRYRTYYPFVRGV